MVLLEAAAGKVIDEGIDQFREKKKRKKEADDLKQASVKVTGSLAAGESKVVSLKSKPKNTALRSGWPFASIDCYNPSGQPIVIEVNEVDSLLLPVPDGAQNGDSFENIGISSFRIKNRGNSSANLDDLDITVSGSPSGVSRGSV